MERLPLPAELIGLHLPADLQAMQHHMQNGSIPGRMAFAQHAEHHLAQAGMALHPSQQHHLPFHLQQIHQQNLQPQQMQQQQQLQQHSQQPQQQSQQQKHSPSDPSVLQPHSLPAVYPPAEYSHTEVVSDPECFAASLRQVHELFGIAEKVPKVGGRELDLHMLYKNVTALGGCEKVIARKLWRDAAESFHYPDTITSVSFVLRKAYITFLWDYEQIHLHNKGGHRLVPPPASQKEANGSPPADAPAAAERGIAPSGRQAKKQRRGADNVATTFPSLMAGSPTQLVAASRSPGQPSADAIGSRGTVVVESRFDAGYFVTVRIGKHEFKGMLYYPPPEHTQQPLPVLEKGKDPLAPKPNKTPFNFFSVDARVKAKDSFPEMSQTDITKKVGEMWQKATDDEKAPYIAMSNQDKTRYQAELEAYNYRLAAQAAAQTAGQAMNAVTAAQHAMANQPMNGVGQAYGDSGRQLLSRDDGDNSAQ